MLIDANDPRRCPEAGVGRLHDIRTDRDSVRRCFNCRRAARQCHDCGDDFIPRDDDFRVSCQVCADVPWWRRA